MLNLSNEELKEVRLVGNNILPMVTDLLSNIKDISNEKLGNIFYKSCIRYTKDVYTIYNRQPFWIGVTFGLYGQVCETLFFEDKYYVPKTDDAIDYCRKKYGLHYDETMRTFSISMYKEVML